MFYDDGVSFSAVNYKKAWSNAIREKISYAWQTGVIWWRIIVVRSRNLLRQSMHKPQFTQWLHEACPRMLQSASTLPTKLTTVSSVSHAAPWRHIYIIHILVDRRIKAHAHAWGRACVIPMRAWLVCARMIVFIEGYRYVCYKRPTACDAFIMNMI